MLPMQIPMLTNTWMGRAGAMEKELGRERAKAKELAATAAKYEDEARYRFRA